MLLILLLVCLYHYRQAREKPHANYPFPLPFTSPAMRVSTSLLFTPSTHLPNLPSSVSRAGSCHCGWSCGSIALVFCLYGARTYGVGWAVSTGSDETAPGAAVAVAVAVVGAVGAA